MTNREFLQQMYTLLQTEPRATVACDKLESMLAERLAQNSDFQERLARAIEDMPFGDTAKSFATFVRGFK